MQINFNKARSAASSTSENKSEFWLNIGIYADVNGDGTETFVSAGGFPLDNAAMKGKTPFAAVQGELINQLLAAASSLEPGTSKEVAAGDFVIQIRRIGESTSTESPVDLSAIAKLFG